VRRRQAPAHPAACTCRCALLQASLVQECTLMHQFNHPNVLPLLASFVEGDELWMVIPFAQHGSVLDVMRRRSMEVGLPPRPAPRAPPSVTLTMFPPDVQKGQVVARHARRD
jgi:serine/threonine protein kinase